MQAVLIKAEALACVQLIVLALVADDGLALQGGEDGVAGCAVRPSLPRTNVPLPSPPRYRVGESYDSGVMEVPAPSENQVTGTSCPRCAGRETVMASRMGRTCERLNVWLDIKYLY